MIYIRVPFAYDADAVSEETGLLCKDVSLAVQDSKDECDINTIVRKFGLTGELPTNLRVPLEGDFSQITDFKTAMNLIREAEVSFMELPADVRERFNHDAGKLVAFVSNPDNRDEAIKLGIVVPPVVPPVVEPIEVRVVAAPGAAGPAPVL